MLKNLLFFLIRPKTIPWSIPGSPQGHRRMDSEDPGSQGGGQVSKKPMNRSYKLRGARSDTPLGRWPCAFTSIFPILLLVVSIVCTAMTEQSNALFVILFFLNHRGFACCVRCTFFAVYSVQRLMIGVPWTYDSREKVLWLSRVAFSVNLRRAY